MKAFKLIMEEKPTKLESYGCKTMFEKAKKLRQLIEFFTCPHGQ